GRGTRESRDASGSPEDQDSLDDGGVGPGVSAVSSAGGVPLSKAFNSLPILKYGIFFGGTSTFSPVLGLRPLRGARFRKRKLPKPRISTSCPACNALTTLRRAASTMMPDWTWVMSSRFATMLIRSAFVIAFLDDSVISQVSRHRPRP